MRHLRRWRLPGLYGPGMSTVQESTRITHTCNHRCGATFTVQGPDAAQIADEWHRKHLLLMHNSTTQQMAARLTPTGWEES